MIVVVKLNLQLVVELRFDFDFALLFVKFGFDFIVAQLSSLGHLSFATHYYHQLLTI